MVRKLTIISIALIVINLVLLGMIFLRRGHRSSAPDRRPPREDFDRRLTHRLGFTDRQMGIYRRETQTHRNKFHEISIAVLETRGKMHHALAEGEDRDVTKALNDLDSLNAIREREVIRYAESILAICDDQQQKEFLQLLESSVEGRRGYHRRRHR